MEEVKRIVDAELARFRSGLEDALATAMTKALDTVVGDVEGRLRQIEEDQARILRHLGLESDDD